MAFKRSAVRSRLSPPPKILEPQWFQDFSFLYGSMKRVVLLTLFQQPRGVSSADISSAMDCLRATSRWPYTLAVILMSLCPSHSCTSLSVKPWLSKRLAQLFPYGIITTNRKSPVYQGLSVIWQGFSPFFKPENRAAK